MFPESKVIHRFLTILVGEIEFPRSWVGIFSMKDSLACLLPTIVNSVFSRLSFSFMPPIHNSNGQVLDIFECHQHIDGG